MALTRGIPGELNADRNVSIEANPSVRLAARVYGSPFLDKYKTRLTSFRSKPLQESGHTWPMLLLLRGIITVLDTAEAMYSTPLV